MSSIPVIQLSLEGMREQIMIALSNRQIEYDSYIEAALENMCRPENLQTMVKTVVEREMNVILSDALKKAFHKGFGWDFIHELASTKIREAFEAAASRGKDVED